MFPATGADLNFAHTIVAYGGSEILLRVASFGSPATQLCAMQVPGALKERLIREIMHVDQVDWDEANVKFALMEQDCKNDTLMYLPHKIGLVTATVSGIVALPMVFSENLVVWFNKDYVTMDLPEARDMETWLEIGSWAWNWMEPPLGKHCMAQILSLSPI